MTRFFKETKCAYVGGGRIDYIILIGLLWFLGVPGTRWLEYRVHLLIEHTLVEFNRQSIGVIKQYPCIVQKSWKIFSGEVFSKPSGQNLLLQNFVRKMSIFC